MELDLLDLDDRILDLMPREEDDIDGANLDFAAVLLEDDGEETVQHISETYNPEAETAPASQDYPELELGVGGLELRDSDSDTEEPPTWKSVPTKAVDPAKTPAHDPILTPDDAEMDERGEPLPAQPGLRIGERRIQIDGVGHF